MISTGGKCATRDSTGAAAFGFEINYDGDIDPWVTFSELAEGVALEFDKLNRQPAELRPALEAAYDPTMPDWPAMVEIDTGVS